MLQGYCIMARQDYTLFRQFLVELPSLEEVQICLSLSRAIQLLLTCGFLWQTELLMKLPANKNQEAKEVIPMWPLGMEVSGQVPMLPMEEARKSIDAIREFLSSSSPFLVNKRSFAPPK